MNFERGKDPKEALGIGLKERVKLALEEIVEEHGQMLEDKDLRWAQEIKLKEKFGIVINLFIDRTGSYGKFTITADYEGLDEPIKIVSSDFMLPISRRVAVKTVGTDLVVVQPYSNHVGRLYHLDYKYKRKNWFKRIISKTANVFRKR